MRAQALITLVAVLTTGATTFGADPALIRFGVIDPPIVAQQDITVRAPTSNHPQDTTPLPLECSGLAWMSAPTGHGGELLVTSDRHRHAVFTVALDPDTLMFSEPVTHVVIRNETELVSDVEAVALHRFDEGWRAYLFSSMSNDPEGEPTPERRRIARIELNAAGDVEPADQRVMSANTLRTQLDENLTALHVPHYLTYSPGKNANTDRWANIEGVGFIPGDRGALLMGLRNPLADNDAILAVAEGADAAFDIRDPEQLRITDVFRLDLGERGVADLRWDPVTRGYLIVAARSNGPKLDDDQPYPLTDLDSAVFWWTGDKRDDPVLIARAADMNIEAVCRIGDSPLIALGTDEGDVSEARSARQSVIILMVFTGIEPQSDAP